jgi:membrane-associated protein
MKVRLVVAVMGVALLGAVFFARSLQVSLRRQWLDAPLTQYFKQKYVDHTEEFFNRYGAVAIVLGRFIAIVRTFIPVLAGATKMDVRRFALYSVIGAFIWTVGLTMLGYLIGNVPVIKNNLEYAIILIVIVSTAPIVIHRLKARRDARRAA